jgi:hypothetical protein
MLALSPQDSDLLVSEIAEVFRQTIHKAARHKKSSSLWDDPLVLRQTVIAILELHRLHLELQELAKESSIFKEQTNRFLFELRKAIQKIEIASSPGAIFYELLIALLLSWSDEADRLKVDIKKMRSVFVPLPERFDKAWKNIVQQFERKEILYKSIQADIEWLAAELKLDENERMTQLLERQQINQKIALVYSSPAITELLQEYNYLCASFIELWSLLEEGVDSSQPGSLRKGLFARLDSLKKKLEKRND